MGFFYNKNAVRTLRYMNVKADLTNLKNVKLLCYFTQWDIWWFDYGIFMLCKNGENSEFLNKIKCLESAKMSYDGTMTEFEYAQNRIDSIFEYDYRNEDEFLQDCCLAFKLQVERIKKATNMCNNEKILVYLSINDKLHPFVFDDGEVLDDNDFVVANIRFYTLREGETVLDYKNINAYEHDMIFCEIV